MKKMSRTARTGGNLRAFFSLLLVVALLCGMGVSSFAATTPELDLTRTGSITVSLDADDWNGSLTAYKAADLYLDNGDMAYELTDDFADSGVEDFEAELGNVSVLANKLAAVVTEKTEGIPSSVGDDGSLVFDGLSVGLYLIVQTKSADGYYDIDPFVVTIPNDVNGAWEYDVEAVEKMEKVAQPKKTVLADENSGENMDGQPVSVGQELTYRIDYENIYDEFAVVVITDTLDPGLTYAENSASDGGVYDPNSRTITWTLDVGAGGSGFVTFSAEVNETALDLNLVSNTAKVRVGDHAVVETNTTENSVPGKKLVNDGTGDGSGDEVQVGDSLTYEITYVNTSEENVTVIITDELGSGLEFVSADHGGSYNGSTNAVTWSIDVPAGEEVIVSVTVRVTEDARTVNEVTNTASVEVGDCRVTTNTVENPVPDEPVTPEKNVSADGDIVNGSEVEVGQELTYEITYYNNHAVPATVTITDKLPDGLDYVEGSATDGGVYDKDTNTVTWVLENVDPLTAGSVSFRAVVNESALVEGEVENTASVVIGDDDVTVTTDPVVNPVPGIPEEPEKSVDADGDGTFDDEGLDVSVGDILTYRITYYNNHRFQRNITIVDTLDENVAFVSASDGGVYDGSTHTVTWTISSVSGGTGGAVTLQVEVLESALAVGETSNTASVKVGNDTEMDSNPVINPVAEEPTADLTIGKEISGSAANLGSSEFTFRVTLTSEDGTAFAGSLETVSGSGQAGLVSFENGQTEVTLSPGETLTILNIPAGVSWAVEELNADDDVLLLEDGTEIDHNVSVTVNGETETARAAIGTIHDSSEVVFTNSYREYFGIDEEIVTDEEDIFNRDAWVKDEAVNEYNAIEIEMTTNLPVVTVEDLTEGEYTMEFHNVLDSELNLDEIDADFSVYIGEVQISHEYYTVEIGDETGDSCSFHVTVDLTALYMDGIITEDDLQGDTEITIFFFADLEGTGLNSSYKSTVWYQIYDADELLYTSNVDVVWVFTFDIMVTKYDAETGDLLAGAEFGIYYDEDCTDQVIRSGENYTVVSDENGIADFYGLADGTYYIKELSAPEGYILSDEVITAVIGLDYEPDIDTVIDSSDLLYAFDFANTPAEIETVPEPTPAPVEPSKSVDTDGDGVFGDEGTDVAVGDTLTYEITYYNDNDGVAEVTITDTLNDGLVYVSASDGGTYDESTGTVTWIIENVEAYGSGSVTVTATVSENALVYDGIENTASVQVGDNPAVSTNTAENPVTEPGEPEVTPEPAEPGESEITPEPAEPGTTEPTPEPGEDAETTPEPGEDTEPNPTPDENEEPVTTVPSDTNGSTPTGGTTSSVSGTSETLPQTGMIFWPIIILAAAGAVLVAAGVILRRRHGMA